MKNDKTIDLVKTQMNLYFTSCFILLTYYHFVNVTNKVYIPLFKEYTLVGGCGAKQ